MEVDAALLRSADDLKHELEEEKKEKARAYHLLLTSYSLVAYYALLTTDY